MSDYDEITFLNDLIKQTNTRIRKKAREILKVYVANGDIMKVSQEMTRLIYLFDAYQQELREIKYGLKIQKIRELKEYLKHQQPLKIRIEFSKCESDVEYIDKSRRQDFGNKCVKNIVSQLQSTFDGYPIKSEFWDIAGRAYEAAKAVVR